MSHSLSSTHFDRLGADPPSWVRPEGGMSVHQLAAASPTRAATSWIRGLFVLSSSQQAFTGSHRGFESPIDSPFAGLFGRAPPAIAWMCADFVG